MSFAETLREHGRPYGPGTFAPPGSLATESMAELRDYKLRVAKRYRVLSPRLAEVVLPDGPLYVSPKIDGELWFALKRDGEVTLCAPNGRMLAGLPVTTGLERALADAGDALVAGELFIAAKDDGARPRVFHVAKALRDPAQAGRVGFKAFDVVRWRGEDLSKERYERRLAALCEAFPESGPASRVATYVDDKRGLLERYREWVETKRFEGVIARQDSGGVYKVKPEISLDGVVVAWSDKLTGDRVELREIHVALVREDGGFHVLGPVASGLDDATRAELLGRLGALTCDSSFRMANREGTLCRFVRPEIVVELKCSDLMASDPGETPTLRPVLAYGEDGWSARAALALPAMIGPVFLRVRDDKRIDGADVGLDQIRQIAPFEGEDEVIPAAQAARVEVVVAPRRAPEIIARKVWVKATKGQTAVRKYVAWATHKSDPRYPAFVVSFTDFAAGRKEPMQRELRVASSIERVDAHIAAWETDNIKKGWAPV